MPIYIFKGKEYKTLAESLEDAVEHLDDDLHMINRLNRMDGATYTNALQLTIDTCSKQSGMIRNLITCIRFLEERVLALETKGK